MLYQLGSWVPRIDKEGTFVAPSADVIGQVEIGAQVGVWFGAVIRGDVERIVVGARTNIQDLAVLHADPGTPLLIGCDVTVGHRAMLHGCVIGDGTLVGMSATILNGARIGRHCIIGAGALVRENQEIPDHSLVVGLPARVTGQVSEEQRLRMRQGAELYVAKAARYLRDLAAMAGSGD